MPYTVTVEDVGSNPIIHPKLKPKRNKNGS